MKAEAQWQPDRRVPYKQAGEVRLLLDVFSPQVSGVLSHARPGIVFFHGGAWNGGAPSQFYPHCRYFASRGMVAVSAEYRLGKRHGTTPFECVADAKSAMRWIRLHAEDLGINPEMLAAGGGSAGGHLAAATAMVPGFDDEHDDRSISPKPQALVLFNPVVDNGPNGFGHKRLKDRWREFSPMHNIREGAPPTIVFLGTEDVAIPVSMMRAFKQHMQAAGARCDVWIYEGQRHGFFNCQDGANRYCDATVYEADRFLASLGYVNGAPELQKPLVEAELL